MGNDLKISDGFYNVLNHLKIDSLKVQIPDKERSFQTFFSLEFYKHDEDFIGEFLYLYSLLKKFASAIKVFLAKFECSTLEEFLGILNQIKREDLQDFNRLVKTEIEDVKALKDDLFNKIVEKRKEENIHLVSLLMTYLKFLEKINKEIEKVM